MNNYHVLLHSSIDYQLSLYQNVKLNNNKSVFKKIPSLITSSNYKYVSCICAKIYEGCFSLWSQWKNSSACEYYKWNEIMRTTL